MRDRSAEKTFEAKLEIAKAEGTAGRKEMLDRLVRMDMEKLISLPASSLAILGPTGLARLATMREDLAGIGRTSGKAVSPSSLTGVTQTSPRPSAHPIGSITLVVLSILMVGVGLDLMRTMLMPWMFDPGVRSRQTSIWPSCPRLDGHVDGCVYTVVGTTLSLGRVADLTDIPIDRVMTANRHLSDFADTALQNGSQAVIWRDRLRLEGASR